MISPGRAVYEIARKEVIEHFRTKRMYVIGGLYALSFLAAAIAVPIIAGGNVSPDEMITMTLFYYSIIGGDIFTTLLAIVFIADAICGEWKDRSLFLLLSKPVARWTVLTGKIMAAFSSVLFVLVPVFAVAVIAMMILVGVPEPETLGQVGRGFAVFLLSVIPYVALGALCTALFKSPLSSFLISIGMAFIGFSIIKTLLLVSFGLSGRLSADSPLLAFFALLDPTTMMDAGSGLMAFNRPETGFFGGAYPLEIPTVILAIVFHAFVYFTIAYLVVIRRDYA